MSSSSKSAAPSPPSQAGSTPLSVAVSSPRKRLYEEAWRSRHIVVAALLASLLGLALLGGLALMAPPSFGVVLRGVAFGFGALFLLSTAAWLALPAWFSPTFRLLAWRTARTGSWLRRKLAGHWMGKVVRAVAVAVILWAAFEIFGGGADGLTALLGGLLLVAFVWTVGLSRRKIFVADFKDFTAADPDKGVGGAVASRLRNELASIVALYASVQESSEAESSKQGPGLSVGVQDPASELGETIGRDFNIKMWGLEIPVGILLAAAGGSLRGPRLSGSLHRDGERYVLIAEISGGGKQGSWRVTQDDLPEEDRGLTGSAVIPRLVGPLAYRIVTGLQDMGSPRWEAVRAFTEGLRSYRKVQRTRKDYHLRLRQAERSFIAALSEDDRFVQCYYNLGVVYQKLNQLPSAEAAFRQAVETDSDRFDGYYALASFYYEIGDKKNTETNATKALALDPGSVEAWNLRGLARAEREPDAQGWGEVDESLSLATALAWRGLCGSIWRWGSESTQAKEKGDFAAIATGNLAETRMQRTAERLHPREPKKEETSGARACADLFLHALCLRPRDPFLHLGRGRALLLAHDWQGAREALFMAYGDGLLPVYRPLRWACLAVAGHQLGKDGKGLVGMACKNFVDFIIPPEEVVLGVGSAASQESGKGAQSNSVYLEMLAQISFDLEQLTRWSAVGHDSPLPALARAVGRLESLESEAPKSVEIRRPLWLRAQAQVHAARYALDAQPERARDLLREAIAILDDHPRQIEKQGLHSLLALACLRQAQHSRDADLLQEALTAAEESVVEEPLSPVRRWVLAEVYSALKDTEQFLQESRAALDLGSIPEILGNPEALASMAEGWFQRASALRDRDSRRSEMESAWKYLDHVRELIESEPSNPEQRIAHAVLHFWLGRFCCELKDPVRGVAQLEIAKTMGFHPIETRLLLGQAYAEGNTFEKAKRAFQEAARLAWKQVWAVKRRRKGVLEARHPEELLAEALLRLSLLYVKSGLRVRQAEQLTRTVMGRRDFSVLRRHDLRALGHEVLGRIHLENRKTDWALEELDRAVEMHPSAEAWSANAIALAEKAAESPDPERWLGKARQACERAEQLDLCGTCQREITATRERLRKLERPQVPAASGTGAAAPAETELELVF